MKTKFKPKTTKKQLKKYWPLLLLIAPGLIYLFIFDYGPMYGIMIAFKDFKAKDGYLGSEWVGLKHFIRFLNYADFWPMIRNTLRLTLYSLATFPVTIIFALLLDEITKSRFKKTVQMITYAPHFLSSVVLCGMITLMMGRDGVFGQLYGLVTGSRENLLAIPSFFDDIYVWSGVWQGVGWGSILYISALSGVSGELIEAAKLDGASRLQVIRHVKVPWIMPTIVITFIMRMGGLLTVGFDKIFLLQNDLNLEVSKVVSTYTYGIGLLGGQLSYSTAIGLFNTLVNLSILFLANKVVKKVSGMGIW